MRERSLGMLVAMRAVGEGRKLEVVWCELYGVCIPYACASSLTSSLGDLPEATTTLGPPHSLQLRK